MSRKERNLMESAFTKGFISVLCSTATLAWGVNLPAHHVVIKGTDLYADGKTTDLGVLDIQQIFGRAGRPQFDTSGDATLITSIKKLENYISLMQYTMDIESKFLLHLADSLNAEICSGLITNMSEAFEWFRNTFLWVRLTKNPMR